MNTIDDTARAMLAAAPRCWCGLLATHKCQAPWERVVFVCNSHLRAWKRENISARGIDLQIARDNGFVCERIADTKQLAQIEANIDVDASKSLDDRGIVCALTDLADVLREGKSSLVWVLQYCAQGDILPALWIKCRYPMVLLLVLRAARHAKLQEVFALLDPNWKHVGTESKPPHECKHLRHRSRRCVSSALRCDAIAALIRELVPALTLGELGR